MELVVNALGDLTMKDSSGTTLFNHKNLREGGLVIGLMVGMMALMSWYLPISTEQLASPILNQLNNAKSCQDVYHADVQQFMTSMMLSLNPTLSKEIANTFQTKAHIYCSDLYNIEKKYGDISDSSKLTCDDLKIVVRELPSDMIKSSVTNDYVSRCLT